MPYNNPERKRQWEREHREQRNAQRRRLRLKAEMEHIVPRLAPDPIPPKEPKSVWNFLAGIGVCLLAVALGALAGASVSLDSGPRGPSA